MSEENKGLVFGETADNSEFEPADEGEYELVIETFEKKKAKTGNNYLNFKFRIRKDVPQKFQGKPIFYTISEKAGDEYFNFYRLNQLVMTQKKEGVKLEVSVDDVDGILQYLQGRHFKGYITIGISPDGKERNEISGDTFAPSEWDKLHPVDATSAPEANEPQDLGDGIKGNNLPDTSNDGFPF